MSGRALRESYIIREVLPFLNEIAEYVNQSRLLPPGTDPTIINQLTAFATSGTTYIYLFIYKSIYNSIYTINMYMFI